MQILALALLILALGSVPSLAQTAPGLRVKLVYDSTIIFTHYTGEYNFTTDYQVNLVEDMEEYVVQTKIFNRQISEAFHNLLKKMSPGKPANTKAGSIIASVLGRDESGYKIVVHALGHNDDSFKRIWASKPLGVINVDDLVPEVVATLWEHFNFPPPPPPARPACFELDRFPEFRDNKPMIGKRLKRPLHEITYRGPQKWMLRHNPITGMYYPVLLKPFMAVVVDDDGKVRYNGGISSRWISLDDCSEQDLLQGLATDVIHHLPSYLEKRDMLEISGAR